MLTLKFNHGCPRLAALTHTSRCIHHLDEMWRVRGDNKLVISRDDGLFLQPCALAHTRVLLVTSAWGFSPGLATELQVVLGVRVGDGDFL